MILEKEKLPVLSSKTTAVLSISYTIFYVLPFYLSSNTRPSPTLSRDAPSVIRARIRFVTVSVIISSSITFYIISEFAEASPSEVLRLLGWYPISIPEIINILLLTSLLFAGPLFEKGIVESGWRDWIQGQGIHESLSSWIGWRNYVAGPVTEEIIFRSLITPLHLLSLPSPTQTVLLTPLYFGIAHIHHFYEYKLTHPLTPPLPALLRSLFQFGYTTLFGWYATFVFLRTGSLIAVVLAHAFCNWCGLPRLWGRVGPDEVEEGAGERRLKEEDSGTGVRDRDERDRLHPQGRWYSERGLEVWWSMAYYAILVAGAAAFHKGLWPLTESEGALARFD